MMNDKYSLLVFVGQRSRTELSISSLKRDIDCYSFWCSGKRLILTISIRVGYVLHLCLLLAISFDIVVSV